MSSNRPFTIIYGGFPVPTLQNIIQEISITIKNMAEMVLTIINVLLLSSEKPITPNRVANNIKAFPVVKSATLASLSVQMYRQ